MFLDAPPVKILHSGGQPTADFLSYTALLASKALPSHNLLNPLAGNSILCC